MPGKTGNGNILTVIHYNYSVGTTEEALPQHLPRMFHSLSIHNIHASQILYISFDAGGNFKQIAAGASFEVEGYENKHIHSVDIKLKGSAASTTFEMVIIG